MFILSWRALHRLCLVSPNAAAGTVDSDCDAFFPLFLLIGRIDIEKLLYFVNSGHCSMN